MIRLFIAIDVPEAVRKEVAGMGQSIANANPVAAEQLHLTLKFIGEVEGSRLLDIRDALTEVFIAKFSIALKGVGTFPPRGMPRILWVGVKSGEHLLPLRNAIEKTLAVINIPRDKKKYLPHLTIARLKNSPLYRLQQFLAGNAFFETAEFAVESFHLYSSRLRPKGAQHTIERSYPLI